MMNGFKAAITALELMDNKYRTGGIRKIFETVIFTA